MSEEELDQPVGDGGRILRPSEGVRRPGPSGARRGGTTTAPVRFLARSVGRCSAPTDVEHRLGDPLGVVWPEAPLLHGRHLRLEEQVGLGERPRRRRPGPRGPARPGSRRRTRGAGTPSTAPDLSPDRVGGDDGLQGGGDLFRAGDATCGGLEQRHRTDPRGCVDGQLESDQSAVGVTDDVGGRPADVIHQPRADRRRPRRRSADGIGLRPTAGGGAGTTASRTPGNRSSEWPRTRTRRRWHARARPARRRRADS